MPNGWSGPDPAEAADTSDYELGTEFRAVEDITITHIRVWAGPGEISIANRRGRIWSTSGGQLGIATLPTDLPNGWSTHALNEPIVRLAGERWIVSYTTGGNYGFVGSGILAVDIPSSDGAVVAVATGSATNGNGVYNTDPGQFPAAGTGSFYGIDCAYNLGAAGNTPPRITDVDLEVSGATAIVTVTVEDDETVAGMGYRVEWGDGLVSNSSSNVIPHTYLSTGIYPLLVSVSDNGGQSDHVAVLAYAVVPDDADLETRILRDQTVKFILEDPTTVVLTPRIGQLQPSGGVTYVDGTPRLPQVFKMISQVAFDGIVGSGDGTERQYEFVLLGPYNAAVAIGDWWEDPDGQRYEISGLIPYNGYEIKAGVHSYGPNPKE